MMLRFNPKVGLVLVRVELAGPTGLIMLRLALDTGATRTLINAGPPVTVGYDPSLVSDRVQMTTGSGVEFVPKVQTLRLRALRQEQTGFVVLAHTLPSNLGIDGLLGLDFLRRHELTINFRTGRIKLA